MEGCHWEIDGFQTVTLGAIIPFLQDTEFPVINYDLSQFLPQPIDDNSRQGDVGGLKTQRLYRIVDSRSDLQKHFWKFKTIALL